MKINIIDIYTNYRKIKLILMIEPPAGFTGGFFMYIFIIPIYQYYIYNVISILYHSSYRHNYLYMKLYKISLWYREIIEKNRLYQS